MVKAIFAFRGAAFGLHQQVRLSTARPDARSGCGYPSGNSCPLGVSIKPFQASSFEMERLEPLQKERGLSLLSWK